VEKRQKIRGLALGLLCAAFALSGCERSEEEPLALLTLDKERIVFDNPAEGETTQAVLRIEADRRWNVGFIGNGHDCRMSVLSGEAGVHELRIETSETNTGRDLHRLGQLTVALDDGSANRTVDLQQRPQAARQTLLMYFCGTDLYSYYKNNLADVAKALSRNILPLGRIVAFTQPAAGEGYVVEYRYDEAASACQRDTLIRYTPLPEPGYTTDPKLMARILGDMAAVAPAERFFGLHLASHAKGWLPASIESSSWLRSSTRRADDLWRKIPGAAETRWFGQDRGRYMDISELAAAIDNSGVRFDYLLFDACFMSSVEALYDLRRAADYIVASPCEVMAHGFPYDTVIPSLFADDGARYDLAAACRNVYEYYNAVDSYKSGCATLTVCDELERLATALHDINAGATKAVVASTLQSYDGMETHQFYDLEEYALALTADDARGQAFVQQMERCFPPEGRFHTAQFFSMYNNRMNDIRYYSGVTTYAPVETYSDDEQQQTYLNEWQQTAWYAATKR